MLIGGLIIGFLIGWFWHRSTVGGTYEGTTDIASTTQDYSTTGTSSAANTGGSSNGSSQQANVMTATGDHYGSADKTVAGSASVSVSDQKAGSSVTVSNVSLDSTGWVAVRDDENGLMGNVLGAQRLGKGSYTNIKVALLRSTTAGKTYHVVVYKDNGDMTFSKTKDMVVLNNGNTVSGSFKAQ